MSTSEVDRWTCTTRLQTLPAFNSLLVEHVAAYHATKPPIPTGSRSYHRPSLGDKQIAPNLCIQRSEQERILHYLTRKEHDANIWHNKGLQEVIVSRPVVAGGSRLHAVVYSCVNAEGLDDLAVVIHLSPLSRQIWQGQESLHLYMHLQSYATHHCCKSGFRTVHQLKVSQSFTSVQHVRDKLRADTFHCHCSSRQELPCCMATQILSNS